MPTRTIDIPIVGPSNNVPQDDPQKTLNFYSEKTGDNWTLKPTPGASLFASLGVNGGGRGSISLGGRLFGVRGAFFQEIVAGVAVVRGTLISTQNPVAIVGALPPDGSGQILIVDDTHGYVFEFVGGVFTLLTEVDHGFVGGLSQAVFAGGYAMSIKPGTNEAGFSDLYNFLSWPGTNFIGLQDTVGNLVALASTGKSVTLFTDSGFEVWTTKNYTPPFAFTQIVSGFGIGCEAPRSVFTFNGFVYWLGGNEAGKGVVYRYTEGGTPLRITDHSTERQIAAIADPSDAIGYCYQSLGHTFYVLSFGAGNETICYDEDSKQWHDRAWRDPLTNYMYAVPYVSVIIHDGVLLGLDKRDGKFFEISNEVYTDNGAPIRRERILPVIPDEADWMTYCGTLELFCTVGNDPLGEEVNVAPFASVSPNPMLETPEFLDNMNAVYSALNPALLPCINPAYPATAPFLTQMNTFLTALKVMYPSGTWSNTSPNPALDTDNFLTNINLALSMAASTYTIPVEGAKVMLNYSTDRGMTYGLEQWQVTAGNSSYSTRVRWIVGGSAFGFVFKLAIVANQFVSWRSVRVTME